MIRSAINTALKMPSFVILKIQNFTIGSPLE